MNKLLFLLMISFVLVLGCKEETKNDPAVAPETGNNTDPDGGGPKYTGSISIYNQNKAEHTFEASMSDEDEVANYLWYVNGTLKAETILDKFTYTFNTAGDFEVTVRYMDKSGTDLLTSSLEISIFEDMPVDGDFTDISKSSVKGIIVDSIEGLKIPYKIVIYEMNGDTQGAFVAEVFGETYADGSFEKKLSSSVSTTGFFKPVLYAQNYDLSSNTFIDWTAGQEPIDDNFMCTDYPFEENDVPGICNRMAIGNFTETFDFQDHDLRPQCKTPYVNKMKTIEIPLGHVEEISIKFTKLSSNICKGDVQNNDDMEYVFNVLKTYYWWPMRDEETFELFNGSPDPLFDL